MSKPPWKSPKETREMNRCNECRRWINHTVEYGEYNHRNDCSRHPGDPPEVKRAKEKGLIDESSS